MTLPAAVPEIPAANVDKAVAYYVNTLGFTFDWGDDQGGIAGISRGNCRLFITCLLYTSISWITSKCSERMLSMPRAPIWYPERRFGLTIRQHLDIAG